MCYLWFYTKVTNNFRKYRIKVIERLVLDEVSKAIKHDPAPTTPLTLALIYSDTEPIHAWPHTTSCSIDYKLSFYILKNSLH